ncbi:hypothetical protein ACFQH1_03195 [Lactiplantibacillus daoliensis]|uniref:Extracellular protein n=1 Tax=Lactiplantibacillus daoliensis TaxID=2559916 RepID=A0ABW1UDS0_9LACO|nr:hypothetical protein [Lactiplantibacillus daoliensis]
MKFRKLGIMGLTLGIMTSLVVTPIMTAKASRRPAPRTMMRLRLKVKHTAKRYKVTNPKRHRVNHHR